MPFEVMAIILAFATVSVWGWYGREYREVKNENAMGKSRHEK